MSLVAQSQISLTWTITRLRNSVLNFELGKIVLNDFLSHELRHLGYDLTSALALQCPTVLSREVILELPSLLLELELLII